MALFYNPPQPYQPPRSLAPELNPPTPNPPVIGSGNDPDYLYNILETWIPPNPQPTQKGPMGPILLYGSWGAQPPLTGNDPRKIATQIGWIPPAPQPRQLPPMGPILLYGSWGAQPPVIGSGNDPDYLYNILETWLPPDLARVPSPGFAPLIPVPGRGPYFNLAAFMEILQTWFLPAPQPRQLPPMGPILLYGSWGAQPPVIGSGNDPDYLYNILETWLPPDLARVPSPGFAPLIPVPGRGPYFNLAAFMEILQTWFLPAPQPRQLPPMGPILLYGSWGANPPLAGNDPGKIASQIGWIPPTPQPTQKGPMSLILLYGSWGANPPFMPPRIPAAIPLWTPADPIWQPRPLIIPFTIPYLPPGQMRALNTILSWWNQGDPTMPPPKMNMADVLAVMPVLRLIVKASWSTRQPGAGFTTRQPGGSFTTREPGGDFEEE